MGRKVTGTFGFLIWLKILMLLIFNSYGDFSDLLRSVQMLKTEWIAKSNGKLPDYSISGKTAALVPEFAVEDLPSAELQPWFLRLQ